MPVTSDINQQKNSIWGDSPRILAIDQSQPLFKSLAVKLSEKGVHSPQFRWASKMEGALSLLRTEPVNFILYAQTSQFREKPENRKKFFQSIQAIRTSNPTTPFLILADHLEEAIWEKVLTFSCHVFISTEPWSSLNLFGVMDHAMRNAIVHKEHSRLTAARNQQLKRERDEAVKMLAQQRLIVADIERIRLDESLENQSFHKKNISRKSHQTETSENQADTNNELINSYAKLLRSYVVMGSENLTNEISETAKQFFESGLTVRDAFKIHLNQVDQLISGIGKTSSRQTIAQSDLLAMELMMHLCDLYQK